MNLWLKVLSYLGHRRELEVRPKPRTNHDWLCDVGLIGFSQKLKIKIVGMIGKPKIRFGFLNLNETESINAQLDAHIDIDNLQYRRQNNLSDY